FESYHPQLMLAELKEMFEKPQAVEIYDLVDALHSCKQAPRKSVSAHVLEMKGYMDQLHALGKSYDNDMAINLINCPLTRILKIKALHSDRGGEYLSQEFKDYLSKNGIIQHLTSPYTPQQNGVYERRNRTLLDMVRSMFNLTNLPLSFWDYALESLESVVRILNMVPTKKVDKTPYEIWHGKAPNLSYLKVWVVRRM
nr:retrotransposon protein, putative, Ty1-copia subclass [Tanacetum cinerariifolium]